MSPTRPPDSYSGGRGVCRGQRRASSRLLPSRLGGAVGVEVVPAESSLLEAGRLRISQTLTTRGHYADVAFGPPKTDGSRRVVSLDPATVAGLRRHRAAQAQERLAFGPDWSETGLVFTAPDGRWIHPASLSRTFDREVKAAGLPRIRLHDLRHTYATTALGAGVPVKVVSERLGHATIAITLDTYAHVLPRMDEQATNAVASLILGSASAEG